jgi:hypothetical protein
MSEHSPVCRDPQREDQDQFDPLEAYQEAEAQYIGFLRRRAQQYGGSAWPWLIAAGLCLWLWHWIPAAIFASLFVLAEVLCFAISCQVVRIRHGRASDLDMERIGRIYEGMVGSEGRHEDITTFFIGPVTLHKPGVLTMQYRIADGTTIKVKNTTHVRMSPGIKIPEHPFDIIAPMSAVTVLVGTIAPEFLREMPLHEYKEIEAHWNSQTF